MEQATAKKSRDVKKQPVAAASLSSTEDFRKNEGGGKGGI